MLMHLVFLLCVYPTVQNVAVVDEGDQDPSHGPILDLRPVLLVGPQAVLIPNLSHSRVHLPRGTEQNTATLARQNITLSM